MGASASHHSTESLSSNQPGSNYIFKFYSRQFEREEDVVEEPDLYLHGYGDDDQQEESAVVTPAVEIPAYSSEDDDYPINTMSANLEAKRQATLDSTLPVSESPSVVAAEPPVDIHQSFETSRSIKQSELDEKYPAMSGRGPACESERNELLQCYKDNSDVLKCRDAVNSYSTCAKSVTSSLLSGPN